MCLEKIPSAAEVNQLGSSGLLHYYGKLNAGHVHILVDGGSEKNFVHPEFVEKWKLRLYKRPFGN